MSQRSKRNESAGIGYHPSALAITLGDSVPGGLVLEYVSKEK